MFIDIHCHLDFYKDEEIKTIVERAKKANVTLILTQGVNDKSNKKVLELAEKYKEVKAALGLYPLDAKKMNEKAISEEIDFIRENKNNIVAIGEVGLDYKEELTDEKRKKQEEIFRKFIKLSIELDKPIIVHSRKAEQRGIEILEEMRAEKVIMHCFSGNFKLVKRIIDNKWALSIPTNVTFSEHFQKVIEIVPIEQLFCETDSPYLHPIKGERNNESMNVIEAYKKIAEIKNLSLVEVERKIEGNFTSLFRA